MHDKCPDCHVAIGELHERGCDWERCPRCGGQMLMRGGCGCEDSERMTFTGQSALHDAAEEYGFYCVWDPDGAGDPTKNYGWTRVEKDHPNAQLDLNRVYYECVWSPQLQKWVTKPKED